jgi:hypothetical protein
MTAPTFPRRDLAVGWHALVDAQKKKALVIGEVKAAGPYVVSALELVSKATEAELNTALEGFEKSFPRKRKLS